MKTNKEEIMNSEIVEDKKESKIEDKKELTVTQPKMTPGQVSMWNNTDNFNQAYTMAKILANTEIVPQSYKGKIGDCIVAIDIANRLGLPPIAVMQNSQVVRGNFSWKGSACKAMIDSCGKYKKTRYVEVGQKGTDDYGIYLEATDFEGNVINGVPVTIRMAKQEGWYGKDGSKWQTMPELMLRYRASAFFMRTECASIAMGFLTVEENEDISPSDKNSKSSLTQMLDGEIGE